MLMIIFKQNQSKSMNSFSHIQDPSCSLQIEVQQPQNIQKEREHQMKPQKKLNTRKKRSYHWTQIQQAKYIKFVTTHRSLFEQTLRLKKLTCIHHQMSKAIKSRTYTQCRSHHQKMLEKYGSLDQIISHLNGGQKVVEVEPKTPSIGYELCDLFLDLDQIKEQEQKVRNLPQSTEPHTFKIVDNIQKKESLSSIGYLQVELSQRE